MHTMVHNGTSTNVPWYQWYINQCTMVPMVHQPMVHQPMYHGTNGTSTNVTSTNVPWYQWYINQWYINQCQCYINQCVQWYTMVHNGTSTMVHNGTQWYINNGTQWYTMVHNGTSTMVHNKWLKRSWIWLLFYNHQCTYLVSLCNALLGTWGAPSDGVSMTTGSSVS